MFDAREKGLSETKNNHPNRIRIDEVMQVGESGGIVGGSGGEVGGKWGTTKQHFQPSRYEL